MSVDRAGPWGSVAYRHFLACGHVEERKRKAPASVLGCTQCEARYEVGDEISYELLRLKLAAGLQVPEDQVRFTLDASVGPLRLKRATVDLTPEQVGRLAKSQRG